MYQKAHYFKQFRKDSILILFKKEPITRYDITKSANYVFDLHFATDEYCSVQSVVHIQVLIQPEGKPSEKHKKSYFVPCSHSAFYFLVASSNNLKAKV